MEVQSVIRVKILYDKKTLLVEADTSKKRNLMLVWIRVEKARLIQIANVSTRAKGQTMLTKPTNQAEFEECWSEVIIKNGLLLMILSFGRSSSQPLVWDNQTCGWARTRELLLERGHHLDTSPYILEQNYSCDRQETG